MEACRRQKVARARVTAGSSSLPSVVAQARPSSQMWIPPTLPAPPARPPPASPTTPGELPEDACWGLVRTVVQSGHPLLLGADVSSTSRSSVTESALDPLFHSTRVEAKVAVSPSAVRFFACSGYVIPLVTQFQDCSIRAFPSGRLGICVSSCSQFLAV